MHPDPSPDPGSREAVTIVVPAKDRPNELAGCLAALGSERRVLVVDDGSTDAGAVSRIAAAAGADYVRREVTGGPAAARNTGFSASTSPFVAFVDSDCVPTTGWLELLLAHLVDPAVGAVAPRIVALEQGGGPVVAYERDRSPLDMGTRPGAAGPGRAVPYVPATALVVRREAFARGFDEVMRAGEDVDFAWRLVARGWTVRYVPEVEVAHGHRTELLEWLRTRVAYNTATAPLERRHPGTLRAVHVSRWGAAVWTAAAAGAPLVALALAGLSAGLARRRLGAVAPEAAEYAGSIVLRGVLRDGVALAAALRGPWVPSAVVAAVASRRARRACAAAFVGPSLIQWARDRPAGVDPFTYTALRCLDDLARGIGVWTGCLRHGAIAPLLPRVGSTPRRIDTETTRLPVSPGSRMLGERRWVPRRRSVDREVER
jgi:mycofactocin system glycosyltransferase